MPDRPGWPTFQQKKKFYDICTRLTLADLNQMVSLVQRGCQTAVQQCGDKEVEVRGPFSMSLSALNRPARHVSLNTEMSF